MSSSINNPAWVECSLEIINKYIQQNLVKTHQCAGLQCGRFFSFEQRKAEPFVRHNCFVAIPPVCCRSGQHRHYRSRTPVRQPFLALASLGSPAGRLAGQPAPLRYGAIALCSQVDSRLSGSGGTIITRYTKSLPGSILHSRQRS